MTRPTEAELAAKSARNRKAKAETWGRDDIIKATFAQVSKAGKVGKPIIPTEHQEQCKVIEWCDQHPLAKHIFAIPNGAKKSPAAAAKFKREGLRKGVPDLFLPVASKGFHGLFIEMKRVKGSVLSVDQGLAITQLGLNGYACFVCHGADEAIAVIQDYLKET